MNFDFKVEYINALLSVGKSAGAGLATIGLVGVGVVFGSLVFSLRRNSSEEARNFFKYAMLGFALTAAVFLLGADTTVCESDKVEFKCLGEAIDKPINTTESIRVERKAPGIITRKSVHNPVQTGIAINRKPILFSTGLIPSKITNSTYNYMVRRSMFTRISSGIYAEVTSSRIVPLSRDFSSIGSKGSASSASLNVSKGSNVSTSAASLNVKDSMESQVTCTKTSFLENSDRKINYQRQVVDIIETLYNRESLDSMQLMSKSDQKIYLNLLLVKCAIKSAEDYTSGEIIKIILPKHSFTKSQLITAFESNGIALVNINFEGSLQNLCNIVQAREIFLLHKFTASQLTSKTLRDECIAHTAYVPNSTRQANPDYTLEFFNALLRKYYDGKHGIAKVENNSTITQVYLDQHNNFTGILNNHKPAADYTKDLLVNLLKFKCNINSQEKSIHVQIDAMAEILESTTISAQLKIETYKEMSINLLGTLSERGIRGFNPSFLVIDNAETAYKRLPDIDTSRCVFNKTTTGGFTTKKEHQAVILNTIKTHTPKTLKYMVEAKGTVLETPLTGVSEIITNL